jgi:RND family efflux transporter MFP subunit
MSQKILFVKGFLFSVCFILLVCASCFAGDAKSGEKKKKSFGSPVVVAKITAGEFARQAEFVGTFYYSHVSKVAAETAGIVESTNCEEGQKIDKSQWIAQLETDLLDTEISGAKASYEQVLVEIEMARKNLERMDTLYKKGSVSQNIFDDHFFRKQALEKQAMVLKASLDRKLLLKRKKRIETPFTGIVIQKSVEKGEWIPLGGTVATIADTRIMDVIVDIPQDYLGFLKDESQLDISFKGHEKKSDFISIVPSGDVRTRTFSVKLRIKNDCNLIEGMEVIVHIPVSAKQEGIMVPRDAVIKKYGQDVIFLVEDSKAKMSSVNIKGYKASMVHITGKGLLKGMQVVIKGNERLTDGQQTRIIDNG